MKLGHFSPLSSAQVRLEIGKKTTETANAFCPQLETKGNYLKTRKNSKRKRKTLWNMYYFYHPEFPMLKAQRKPSFRSGKTEGLYK